MNRRIIFVDDERSVLAAFRRNLAEHFEIDLAASGEEALAVMGEKGPHAVMVADMRMPGMTGVELLSEVHRRHPETVRVMLTGNSDQRTAMEAVNRGQVFRFLTKPCGTEELSATVRQALEHYRLVQAERDLLEGTLRGTVQLLSEVLAMAEPHSFGRGQRIRDLVHRVTRQLGVMNGWEFEVGALLSELGWITIPPELVMKVRSGHPLSGEEESLVGRVPALGADLLERIPRLENVAAIVRHQEVRCDGVGQRHGGPTGEDIPLGARILKVVGDLVRLEAEGLTLGRALDRLQRRLGWYDPKVLAAVFEVLESMESAQEDPGAAAERVVAASLGELYPGCILVEDVRTLDGVLIVTSGTQITPPLLNRLRNFAGTSGVAEPLKVRMPGAPPAG